MKRARHLSIHAERCRIRPRTYLPPRMAPSGQRSRRRAARYRGGYLKAPLAANACIRAFGVAPRQSFPAGTSMPSSRSRSDVPRRYPMLHPRKCRKNGCLEGVSACV